MEQMGPNPAGMDIGMVRAVAEATRGMTLLVLHGSRARGDAREGSDWDFAYLAGAEMDELALRVR
jgi:predicted nucleotidyltransferase